jgi:hypothetical protein
MSHRRRFLKSGLRRGYAKPGQEAAVVSLHPLLGQVPTLVAPERADDFPLEVLAGGLKASDRGVGEDSGEVA